MFRANFRDFRQAARAAARELRQALRAMDFACDGTLSVRTKLCGQPTCACHEDPSRRHGPYREWTRVREGRLAHSHLSPEQAELLAVTIANHREVKRLVARWERATERMILALAGPRGSTRRKR